MEVIKRMINDKIVYSLYFNQKRCEEFGVYLADIPQIETSNTSYESQTVGGRLGAPLFVTNAVDNIKITCIFGVLNKNTSAIMRDLKKWLNGSGILEFTETQDSFYKVLFVERGNFEREITRFGKFEVTFICHPYEYAKNGQEKYDVIGNNFYNGNHDSKPKYIITGEGMCTLTVNGKEFTANVGQNIVVDVELMESYKLDNTPQSTAVKGKYEDLILKHGNNIISVTNNFGLKIIPCWGWCA